MGLDDLMTKENLKKMRVAWEKDKTRLKCLRVDLNGVDHIDLAQDPTVAVTQAEGVPQCSSPPASSSASQHTFISIKSGPAFPNHKQKVYGSVGREKTSGVIDGDIFVQSTRPLQNSG